MSTVNLVIAVTVVAILFAITTATPVIGKPPPAPDCSQLPLVSRSGWNGTAPLQVEPLQEPVPFVVIHHTYIPDVCNTSTECERRMRQMQKFHMDKGWNDIGYNFLIGGDNRIYIGRGWGVVGAHAPKYNFMSMGISFIGNYMETLPQASMIALMRTLIQCGISQGHIAPDYKLVGHRQVRDTLCPGDRFYKEIQSWENYNPMIDIQPPPKDYRKTTTTTTTTTTATESTTIAAAENEIAAENETAAVIPSN